MGMVDWGKFLRMKNLLCRILRGRLSGREKGKRKSKDHSEGLENLSLVREGSFFFFFFCYF